MRAVTLGQPPRSCLVVVCDPVAGLLQQLLERRSKPVLGVGERYCPDCGGTRRTIWNVPAYPLRCKRCHGTGKVPK